ncbi:anti-H(O) lectin-like [Gossypium raimondii]|uniref:anti-H(O) lectin-like n=1 Tax=Gossypium raimondii TaxID=29730 RepID=UPI00063ACCED|nr:anti-H(O) lectin-like [Gossypium raimondii]
MMNAEDAENLYLKSQNPAFRSILSILVMGLRVAASSMDDHNINFIFTGFTPNMPDIVYEADAYASNNAVQLTLNQLKQNLRGGDGFAFFIAPNGSKIPPNSGGGHLGLQSYGIVNSPFVAVEFDTFDNPWDPFGLSAHVGIGLNSIETSLTAVKWWWNEIANGGLVNAFITYNSSTNNLSVLLLDADGFTRQNLSRLSATLDLSIYLPEWVTFGFSGTTGRKLLVVEHRLAMCHGANDLFLGLIMCKDSA